ncbi:hypothetical protein PHYPSEUDO_015546 [Phytophthora pseudosyringae]|uniref:Uncharacterized protein n=1 Tax=Phytophthora pseudosyringae TaxID=221518 RepID=A0A8T1W009_9STRA|nr:hypothetical protein PHYPSEUDO_015546 [Phytophthora pseudosyringae]
MDAQTGWRRPGSGAGGVRRPGADSAARTAPNSSRTPPATTQPRTASVGALRASNQAAERGVKSRKSTSTESEAAPSRWREMRQSVRAKATLETAESRPVNARIPDLCPDDREKVAKLVRRIVEVGTLHEEGEKEFQRQREELQAEVKELRQQVRQDADEIQVLSDELRSARRKAQLFEERVLVLEDSTDAETRARLEAEQTLDLLKLEVDKLRALVQRQQDEMHWKTKEQQEQFDAEVEQANEKLKEAQELLLEERNGRLLDKQKALDLRLEHSATAGEEKLDRLHSLLVEQQQEMQIKVKEQQEEMLLKTREQQERFEIETNRLKQQLQAAQQQLEQERTSRLVEEERVASHSIKTPAVAAPAQRATVPDRPTASPDEQVPARGTDQRPDHFVTEIQGDLALFEEVKDLYAEDLFASRRWGGARHATNAAATGAAVPRPATERPFEAPSWQFASAEPPRPPINPSTSLAPALSVLEASVQEAIERDMEALLRSEALSN